MGRCGYSISYLDGSFTEGFLFTEFVRAGESKVNSVVATFEAGCTTRESEGFLDTDGILGLTRPFAGRRAEPIYETYFNFGYIQRLEFTLCYGIEGGFMQYGGYLDDARMIGSHVWVPVENVFFW